MRYFKYQESRLYTNDDHKSMAMLYFLSFNVFSPFDIQQDPVQISNRIMNLNSDRMLNLLSSRISGSFQAGKVPTSIRFERSRIHTTCACQNSKVFSLFFDTLYVREAVLRIRIHQDLFHLDFRIRICFNETDPTPAL